MYVCFRALFLAPDWAAINIGIFLCIDCAGIHRRLGTTISRIKSIKLDQWTHEMIEVSTIILVILKWPFHIRVWLMLVTKKPRKNGSPKFL